MFAKYYDMEEFAECVVIPALGDAADRYDVEGIAYTVSRWDGHFLRARTDIDHGRFWEIAEKYELEEAGAEC